MENNKDYYKILGIKKNATLDDIKKAYKKMAVKHHPDKGGNSDTFKDISEAYQVLSNTEKRQLYDNNLNVINSNIFEDFRDANELFNFMFNGPLGPLGPLGLLGPLGPLGPLGRRNSSISNFSFSPSSLSSYSRSSSVIISNGKKIETVTEIKNGIKSEKKIETDLSTGKVLESSKNSYLK